MQTTDLPSLHACKLAHWICTRWEMVDRPSRSNAHANRGFPQDPKFHAISFNGFAPGYLQDLPSTSLACKLPPQKKTLLFKKSCNSLHADRNLLFHATRTHLFLSPGTNKYFHTNSNSTQPSRIYLTELTQARDSAKIDPTKLFNKFQ
jgi:hypothetical protein